MNVTAVCLFLVGQVATAQMPPSRQALQSEIAERQQAISRAAGVFLDRSRPADERVAAARGVQAFVDPQQMEMAAKIVLDTAESPEIRALALSRIEHVVDRNPELVTAVLQLAGTAETPQPLRKVAVRVLADLSFSSMSMQKRSEEFRPVLRKMTRDSDTEIRRIAFGILAANGDDFAEQRLMECLRAPATAPLSASECVHLLGLRVHGDAYPLLFQIFQRPPDEATRIEAIRLLGGYPVSRPSLIQVLRNPEESEMARLAAMGTLYANIPEEFPAIVLPIIRDESASDALRMYALQAVRQRRKALLQQQKGATLSPFDDAVSELARSTKSERVRKAAQDYRSASGLDR